jgi:CRISPR-associated endonuclease/helicase Cas3
MSDLDFGQVFKAATGFDPYAYQCRLACGDKSDPNDPNSLGSGSGCESRLINVPTGLGKTGAVVLAWLWNRILHPCESHRISWPRRLVYCLPMRTLVEQTVAETTKWISELLQKAEELGLDANVKQELRWLIEHSPILLMGGEELDEHRRVWDLYPEKPAVLVGTQDMLLSRALNRGYGMSRYRWPMHFGLLNSDSLWVMDETQLMGVGVETSAQLDGFRHGDFPRLGEMPEFGACLTWWMSATLDDSRLTTVDHPNPRGDWPKIALSQAERTSGPAQRLFTAPKPIQRCSICLSEETKKTYESTLAQFIKKEHQEGTLTLVVVNRVDRAQEIYEALTAGKRPLYDCAKVALVHSRFRPRDRRRHESLLFGEGDRIVIATQAIEAGVDVSARLLITELAPWSSLVQRFGRCNRRGEHSDAQIRWVDIEIKQEKDGLVLPYSKDELDKARDAVENLLDANARSLGGITGAEEPIVRPIIRRRDLIDLFDTTPDLCGQDLDISRYIRDGEDGDVQFFWRDLGDDGPTNDEKPPDRDELCRVSIAGATKFLKDKKRKSWRWNSLEKKWETVSKILPGAVYLLQGASGGYSDALGWTGMAENQPTAPSPEADASRNEAYDGDPESAVSDWQTIAEHTEFVVQKSGDLTKALALTEEWCGALQTAARWHDVGKAHAVFQNAVRDELNGTGRPKLQGSREVAKAPNDHRNGNWWKRLDRPHFRHELASALAWLLAGPQGAKERDLIAYLIAAHHGKVRLSIRSMPNEAVPTEAPDRLFARGVWQEDELELAAVLLDGSVPTSVRLDLSYMQMGEGRRGPSWLARTVALRDRLGPFLLAYLETLLRSADARASMERITDA